MPRPASGSCARPYRRSHARHRRPSFAVLASTPVQLSDEAGTNLLVQPAPSGMLAVTSQPPPVGGPDIGGLTTPRTATRIGPAIATDNGVIIPVDGVLIP